jgi:hypothetical protein
MGLSDKAGEIQRLIKAFDEEASKFHDISLSTFYISTTTLSPDRNFRSPNHAIMLWQYYGTVCPEDGVNGFMLNLEQSDLQWGLGGAQFSLYAVIEGETAPLFIRIAQRAGSIFDLGEMQYINSNVINEIRNNNKTKQLENKPIIVTNKNPLSIWLNFLLYHLSLVSPGREKSHRIEPDPFSLSLLAL